MAGESLRLFIIHNFQKQLESIQDHAFSQIVKPPKFSLQKLPSLNVDQSDKLRPPYRDIPAIEEAVSNRMKKYNREFSKE
jgi:hypothetical protein